LLPPESWAYALDPLCKDAVALGSVAMDSTNLSYSPNTLQVIFN